MTTKLRKIVTETLEQVICLQTPTILMEDIYESACDNIRQCYKAEHKAEPDEKLLKSYVMEEFEILLYDPRMVGFWHYHNLLKQEKMLTNFDELKAFVEKVKHEKILDYMLTKAITREDLKVVKLLAPRVEINMMHLMSAMKNKDIFEEVYPFNDRNKSGMLSIACILEYTDIQEFLLEHDAEFNEKALPDLGTEKYQHAVNYQQAKIIKDVFMEKISAIDK
jgi:hypothetical protein